MNKAASAKLDLEAASAASLSRQQLYDLVWTRPLTGIAADFGISRNGLAKICDRLMIPYAGRGYWAKAQGHAPPLRPPLPPAPANSDEIVTIAPGRSTSRRVRTRLSRESRAEQLIEAAAQIIAREGLHAASMKRVAREVGISETQAHNYFSRRADLLAALARRELDAMNAIRHSEIERGHDSLTRVTLSTVTYLRQVVERGAVIQTLLGSPEVRAGLKAEREARAIPERWRVAEQLESRYGVPGDIGYGATVILSAICLRAGRLLADKKISLDMAERLSLAITTAGNRSITAPGRAKRTSAPSGSAEAGRD